MIINYDKNPNLTTDQKLQSLINALLLAFNEVTDELKDIRKELDELKKKVEGE